MPALSPAVKVGIVITVIILAVSAVLDVFDIVGWNMVDIATPGLLIVALAMMLIGLLARSALVSFPGTMNAAMEIQAHKVARDGAPIGKTSQIDWPWLVAAIVPAIAGFLMFVIF